MPATPPTPVAPPRPETAGELIDKLQPDDIEALAALCGAPAGVAELAFSAFPSGTRDWLVTYRPAVVQPDGTLALADLGREAIEQAARRFPEPSRVVAEASAVVVSLARSCCCRDREKGRAGRGAGEPDRVSPVRLHGDDRDVLPGNHARKTQAGLEILKFRHAGSADDRAAKTAARLTRV